MIRSLTLSCCIYLVVGCASSPDSRTAGSGGVSVSSDVFRKSDDRVKAFELSGSVDDLEQALNYLEGIAGAANEPVDDAIRKERTKKLLRLVKVVEQSMDPSFDPNDGPQFTVMPPWPSTKGSDPANEARLHDEYIAAVKANEKKAEYCNRQIDLRNFYRELEVRVCNAIADDSRWLPGDWNDQVLVIAKCLGLSHHFQDVLRLGPKTIG